MLWSGALVLINLAEALDDMLELLKHQLTRLLSGVLKPTHPPGMVWARWHPDSPVLGLVVPCSIHDFCEREPSDLT